MFAGALYKRFTKGLKWERNRWEEEGYYDDNGNFIEGDTNEELEMKQNKVSRALRDLIYDAIFAHDPRGEFFDAEVEAALRTRPEHLAPQVVGNVEVSEKLRNLNDRAYGLPHFTLGHPLTGQIGAVYLTTTRFTAHKVHVKWILMKIVSHS